jgi:hypothetical protein
MKISKTNAAQSGSLLLPTLFIAGIIGVALASYLTLAETQNVSIFRSQNWNTIMAVTEAGVEDGMQLINRYAGSFEPEDLYQWTNTTSGDGWANPSPNVYHVTRYVTNNAANSSTTTWYDVWIYNTNNMPAVVAEGNVPWTYQYAQSSLLQPIFAVVPGAGTTITTTTNAPPPDPTRKVCVQTHFDPLFVVAMAAKDKIDMNGNDVATDSFDSADWTKSNSGWYPSNAVWKTKANGHVCTDSVLMNSLDVGNANIKGTVRTGPGTNTIEIGSGGSVGDRPWVEGGYKGIKQGWSSTDFNVAFPDVADPKKSWLPAIQTNTTVDGVTYAYVISYGGNYLLPSLSAPLLVNAPAGSVVRIRCDGDVRLAGQDVIRVVPGVKVRWYQFGGTMDFTGQAYIDNQSGKAYNFYLFGLPTCTQINFGGNNSFYGGIYAPSANFRLGGGGNNTYDFVGASVTRTVQMNGHYNFHYDENLAKVGPGRGYIPVAWQEM